MSVMGLMRALRESLTPALATLPLPVRQRETDAAPVTLLAPARRPVVVADAPEAPAGETAAGMAEAAPADGVPRPVRPARLFLGCMPPTVPDALARAPFVAVQPLDGEDGDGLHRVRLALRVCVTAGAFEAAEDAETDLHNLLSLLRRHLLSLPDGLLTPRYRLVREDGGLGWTRPDEQFPPFVQAHLITSWEMQGVSHVAV